jgi:protein-S-isoprenylcysteine O-methyltransferase Ste14
MRDWASWIALIVYLAGMGVVVALRDRRYRGATGRSGIRHGQARTLSAEWWSELTMSLSTLLALVSPILAGVGWVRPVAAPAPVAVAGLVLALAGFAGAWAAQEAMGDSWRAGVDPDTHTPLVTTGVYGVIRNPIFVAMIAAFAGLTMMVPSVPQALALICLTVGYTIQARVLEEPYLAAAHGDAYAAYAARVGRFVPLVGRLRE